jgi:hypothetical protein
MNLFIHRVVDSRVTAAVKMLVNFITKVLTNERDCAERAVSHGRDQESAKAGWRQAN